MSMNPEEIRNCFHLGDSPADILRTLTSAGVEYPEAEWMVIKALRLGKEAAAEMKSNYDDQV